MPGRKRSRRSTETTKYIPVSEAAKMHGVTAQSVRAWANKGQVKSRKIGGRVMIDAATLSAMPRRNGHSTNGSTTPAPPTAASEGDLLELAAAQIRSIGETLLMVADNMVEAIEDHDARVRAETGETLINLGTNLARR